MLGDAFGSRRQYACAAARHRHPNRAVSQFWESTWGRLGFLAEVEPGEWSDRLRKALAGDYWVEERMMVHAEWWRDGESWAATRRSTTWSSVEDRWHVCVRLSTYIDGGLSHHLCSGWLDRLDRYPGRTAYRAGRRGPIMPPELKTCSLSALAPHLSLERSHCTGLKGA